MAAKGNTLLLNTLNKRGGCLTCSRPHPCPASLLTDSDAIKTFANAIKQRRLLSRNQNLIRAGEPFRSLFLVRSGSLKVYSVDDDGEEQVIGFYLPGDVVGLEGLGAGAHGCTAVALETTAVCEMSFDRLDQLSASVSGLRQALTAICAREIAHEHALLRLMGKKSAEQRLAGFLLLLSRRLAGRGYSGLEFTISMSRHDIGNHLGVALETISRLFARFQRANVLDVNRRRLMIQDMPALYALAGERADDARGQAVTHR